ncbi:hypothetical protein DNTS_011108 [Danionella cerebrum]|uniref:Melanoregulin n=1 Tax=Danionella cerebrum TaxID=2873325 RepID=A0A553MMF1_9TELE|nr:hypothetical protein DNTS_011108 [Danionella translucida]
MGSFYSSCCPVQDTTEEKDCILRQVKQQRCVCGFYDETILYFDAVCYFRSSCSTTNNSETALISHEREDTATGPDTEKWTCTAQGESDSELNVFIQMRNKVDKDTEEWEKLNFDIYTLKCARKEVGTRWKKILLQLGYQREVDSLLMVSRGTVLSDGDNVEKARELLHIVSEETSLFPRGLRNTERYIFVMDRLVSLDSAEDFVRLAKEKYPVG